MANYTGNSIVDYLNSVGQKSDFNTRSSLAQQKGITGYTGSAQQNLQLLNSLRGGSQPTQPQNTSSTIQSPGSSVSSGNGTDFNSVLQRSIEMSKQNIQPVISQLQSNIPSINQQYSSQQANLEAQRQPLKERYDQLLATVKGQQTQAVNRQTLATSNELGKRGILPSSGASQQEIINATEPVNQQYTALANDVGFQGAQAQQDITNQQVGLSSQQIQALRDVNNAIAQAQMTGNTDATKNALSQIQLAQSQQAQDLANKQFQQIALPTSQADIALKQAQAKLNDPAYVKELLKQMGITIPGMGSTSAPPGQITNQSGGPTNQSGGPTNQSRPPLGSFITK